MTSVRMDEKQFWATRSAKYEKLEWASKSDYLNLFLAEGRFAPSDTVLDVGTGTGIIARTLAPHVRKVHGVDISEEMLKKARALGGGNIEYSIADAYQLPFAEGSFDKLTARMVFHHLVEETQSAMIECRRVLKKGGRMVFSEGVPPTKHVVPFYTEMFKLKEDRITFMDEDLEVLMQGAGFVSIRKTIHIQRQASIRNWLENSGLPQTIQNKIFQMHIDLDEQGKRDYRMTIKDGDCFIDMKFVILTGEKS